MLPLTPGEKLVPLSAEPQPHERVLPSSSSDQSQGDKSSPTNPRSRCQAGPPRLRRLRRPQFMTPGEGAPIHLPGRPAILPITDHSSGQPGPPPSKLKGSCASQEQGLERLQGGFHQCLLGAELAFHHHLLQIAPSTRLGMGVSLMHCSAASPLLVQSCAIQAEATSPTWLFKFTFK